MGLVNPIAYYIVGKNFCFAKNSVAVKKSMPFRAHSNERSALPGALPKERRVADCAKVWYNGDGGENMSDFALAYFNTELDKLDVPSLTAILEKVKTLLAKKTGAENSFKRELGGFEDGFFMASDFDETPECFKEYV